MNHKADITAEELRAILSYNPDTGIFNWRTGSTGHKVTDVVGYFPSADPTRRFIGIKNRHYRASNLAWLWMTGVWPCPNLDIDHRDRDASNDRWDNLRPALRGQNNINRKKVLASSGILGVEQRKDCNRFVAKI